MLKELEIGDRVEVRFGAEWIPATVTDIYGLIINIEAVDKRFPLGRLYSGKFMSIDHGGDTDPNPRWRRL